ncbi:MAG: bifunctional (p)ppGpp synthetase/guanosine-3',5'-bis(diphosphate) 3'-pyrophosphohydrolase [Rhodanobacteraceae bacterium]
MTGTDIRAQPDDDFAEALAEAHERLRDPAAASHCSQVLTVLQQLHCDSETLAAWARYVVWEAQAAADDAPRWPDSIPASQRRLLDGQYAAGQVWALHEKREPGSAVEGLRRLLLAIIGDIRVVFILLARQLVRLRDASQLPAEQRQALAQLSADIHAPLANRLGIWQLKWELEDLAFRYLQPDAYQRIARLLDERRDDREAFIAQCIAALARELDKVGVRAELAGRPKHIYSIWKKMQRKGADFSDLYDIRAVRILVDDVPACYTALGLVHSLWPYIPGEFDDYIARPKGNDYKSLHTAVHGPEGKVLEVQIRTRSMHKAAELGVAAHWRYKEGGGTDSGFEARLAWMRQLLEGREETDDDSGLMADLRTELVEDRVYLLSPRGDVYDLPVGATVLDFAYHVHTEVGHRCRGAKVNGRIVPLTHQPASGDRIEVLTSKKAQPSRDWLSSANQVLNTHRARSKVRAWFRHNDMDTNLATGQSLYDRELRRLGAGDMDIDDLLPDFRFQTRNELLLALALGEVSSGQIARVLEQRLAPEHTAPSLPARAPQQPPGDPGALKIAGVGNLLSTLARCCQPLPGDAVCGFITRGHGITVHRADCNALARLRARDANRIIDVEWGEAPARAYQVDIEVRGYDRKGLQKDVTATISNSNAHILASSSHLLGDSVEACMRYTVRIGNFAELSALLARIDALANVIEARRLGNS